MAFREALTTGSSKLLAHSAPPRLAVTTNGMRSQQGNGEVSAINFPNQLPLSAVCVPGGSHRVRQRLQSAEVFGS